jgi:hypothetical protein
MAIRGFMALYDDTAIHHRFAQIKRRTLLGSVLAIGGKDRFVEAPGEHVGIAGGQAGGEDWIAYNDEERAGVDGVDVDGKELIGSYEGEGDEGDSRFDGHIGAAGHHGL